MKNFMWMMLLATALTGCNNEPVDCPVVDGNAASPHHDEFAEMKRVVQSGYSPGVDARFPRQVNPFRGETAYLWRRTIGKGEPPDWEESQRPECVQAKTERETRLKDAKQKVDELIKELPTICTNSSPRRVMEHLDELARLLDGFRRRECSELLQPYSRNLLDMPIWNELTNTEEHVAQLRAAVNAYCMILGKVADLVWVRTGNCFHAAEIDCNTCRRLKIIQRICRSKNWREMESFVDAKLRAWTESRYDPPTSNLKIACDEVEELKELGVAEERDPMYRSRLDNRWIWIRKEIGRYPKWAGDELGQCKAKE